jgi:hypothetical protein
MGSEERAAPRPRATAKPKEVAEVLGPYVTSLTWLEYGESRDAKLNPKTANRQGPMIRAVWGLTGGRPINKTCLQAAFALLASDRHRWFRVQADADSWGQAMAARLGALMAHVAKAAGRRETPRWVLEIKLPKTLPQAEEEPQAPAASASRAPVEAVHPAADRPGGVGVRVGGRARADGGDGCARSPAEI